MDLEGGPWRPWDRARPPRPSPVRPYLRSRCGRPRPRAHTLSSGAPPELSLSPRRDASRRRDAPTRLTPATHPRHSCVRHDGGHHRRWIPDAAESRAHKEDDCWPARLLISRKRASRPTVITEPELRARRTARNQCLRSPRSGFRGKSLLASNGHNSGRITSPEVSNGRDVRTY